MTQANAAPRGPSGGDYEPTATVRTIALVGLALAAFGGVIGLFGLLLWPIGLALIWYARRRHRDDQYRLQTERNDRARALLESLGTATARSRRFVLYLRPFASIGRLPVPLARADSSFFKRLLFGDRFDLELFVSKALRDAEPAWEIIAIGDVGGSIGAGKIVTDDAHWQAVFDRLATHADAIVLAPFARPGTRWEIARLSSQPELLAKTLFVMAPASLWSWPRLAMLWSEMRRHVADLVTGFPAYRRRGLVFRISPADQRVWIIEDDRLALRRFAAQAAAAAACPALAQRRASRPTEALDAALRPLVARGDDAGAPVFPVISATALPRTGPAIDALGELTASGLLYEHDDSRSLGPTLRLFPGVMDAADLAGPIIRLAHDAPRVDSTDHPAIAAMKELRVEEVEGSARGVVAWVDRLIAPLVVLAVALLCFGTLVRVGINSYDAGLDEVTGLLAGAAASIGLGRWAGGMDGWRGFVAGGVAFLLGALVAVAAVQRAEDSVALGETHMASGLPLWPSIAVLVLGGVALALAGIQRLARRGAS